MKGPENVEAVQPNQERTRAIIGARTSSADAEGDSIQAQVAELRKWCEENRYDVVDETIEDGVSGALPVDHRPELQRGLELLRSGHADAYVWRGNDRLGRRADTGQLIESHRIFGEGIIFSRVPKIQNRFASVIMRSSFSGYAEGERVMIYDRTRSGRNNSASSGEGVGIGTLPRWLRFHRHARTKRGEIASTCLECNLPEGFRLVEIEAARVRDVLLGGRPELVRQGRPDYELVRLRNETCVGGLRVVLPLREESVEAEYRGQERASRARERRHLLRKVLDCTTIDEAKKTAEDLGLYTQLVPSPLTWEQFTLVRKQALAVPNGRRGRPPKKPLPLQGHVFCGVHELAFTPVAAGGGPKYKGNVYGQCTAGRQRDMIKRHGRCETPRLPWLVDTRRGQSLISAVDVWRDHVRSDPRLIQRAVTDTIAFLTKEIDHLELQTGDVIREAEDRREELKRWAIAFRKGDISEEDYEEGASRLRRQLSDAERWKARVGGRAERLDALRQTRDLVKQGLSLVQTMENASLYFGGTLEQFADRADLRLYIHPDGRLTADVLAGFLSADVRRDDATEVKDRAFSRPSPSRS
jgi:DNA invertase Pin-like site-specific DNA recombinase